ncbi:MAG: DUF1542 domain-containing protein [Clostridiales bacterium]|nr:DUF1542 domain-containing protein [Clostridiales bacterium]
MKSNLITKKTIATAIVLIALVLCMIVSVALASSLQVATAAEATQQATELQQAREKQIANAEKKFKLEQSGAISGDGDIVYDDGDDLAEEELAEAPVEELVAEEPVEESAVASEPVISVDELPEEDHSGENDVMPIASTGTPTTADQFKTYWNSSSYGTITLGANIQLTASQSLNNLNRSLTLNLGNYTLSGKDRLYVYANGSLTINGDTGAITSRIFVDEGGQVTLNGGLFHGGVTCNDGSFTMTGGTISTTTSYNATGVVFWGEGTSNVFNMSGGTINGCIGEGVKVFGGTCNLSGGTITGNQNCGMYVSDSATFNLSGAPKITGNTSDVRTRNLYGFGTINITSLSSSARIGIYKGISSRRVFTSGGVASSYKSYFTCDDPDYCIGVSGKELTIGPHNWSGDVTWNPSINTTLASKPSSVTATFSLKCNICSTTTSQSATVEEDSYSAPTCTDRGFAAYTASLPSPYGISVSSGYFIAATGHSWSASSWTWNPSAATQASKPSSVTATASLKCSKCSTTTSSTVTATAGTYKAPTCTATGSAAYTATLSATYGSLSNSKTYTISATGHSWSASSWTWNPSATTQSSRPSSVSATASLKCGNCSTTTSQTVTAIAGTYKAPTCTATGSAAYTATLSSTYGSLSNSKTYTISALGHKWYANASDWTWTPSSTTITVSQVNSITVKVTLRCSNSCGTTVTNQTPTVSQVSYSAPTCTVNGSKVVKASVTYQSQTVSTSSNRTYTVSATGHSWTANTFTGGDSIGSAHTRKCANNCGTTDTHNAAVTAGTWNQGDDSRHNGICNNSACNITIYGAHTGAYSESGTTHYRKCSVCSKYQSHTENLPSKWTNANSAQHYGKCTYSECAVNIYKDHGYGAGYVLNGTQHKRTCTANGCGKSDTHDPQYPDSWKGSGIVSTDTQHTTECLYNGCYVTVGKNHDMTWTNTSLKHWEYCKECNYTRNDAAHDYGNTYINDGEQGHHQMCQNVNCKYENATVSHGDLLWKSTDASKHWQYCQKCVYETEHVSHELEWVTTSQTEHWQHCDVCTHDTVKAVHVIVSYKSVDETNHHGYCDTCSKSDIVSKHIFDEGSNWSQSEGCHFHACQQDCGYEGKDRSPHVVLYWAIDKTDNNYHIGYCKECDNLSAKAPHTYSEEGFTHSVAGHWYACDDCGSISAGMTVHNWSDFETYPYIAGNDGTHYQACPVCKEETGRFAHTDYLGLVSEKIPATCTSYGQEAYYTCVLCKLFIADAQGTNPIGDAAALADWLDTIGLGKIDKLEHAFSNAGFGVCANCGYFKEGNQQDFEDWLGGLLDDFDGRQESASEQQIDGAKVTNAYARNKKNANATAEPDRDYDEVFEVAVIAEEGENVVETNIADLPYLTERENAQYKQEVTEAGNRLKEAYAEYQAALESGDGAALDVALAKAIEAGVYYDLVVTRWEAKNEIRRAAQEARDEIDQRVADGDLSPEDGEILKDLVGQAEEDAIDRVDDAKDKGEIGDVLEDVVEGGKFDDIAGTKSEDIDNELKKDAAKKALEDKAKELEYEVKRRPGLSEEDRKGIIDRIQEELAKALEELNSATDSESVESAKQKGLEALENAELNYFKDKTLEGVNKKAQEANDALNKYPELSEEDRKAAQDAIEEARKKAEKDINDAEDVDDVKKAGDAADKAFGDIIQGVDDSENEKGHQTPGTDPEEPDDPDDPKGKLASKKAEAKEELEQKAKDLVDEVNSREGLSDEDKKGITDRINDELTKAEQAIDNAVDIDKVDEAKKAGEKALEEAELNYTKEKAREEVVQKGENAKSEIEKRIEELEQELNNSATSSERKQQIEQELKDLKKAEKDIDKKVEDTLDAIDEATTTDEVNRRVAEAEKDIGSILDSVLPSLEKEKQQARDALEKKAKELKEEINNRRDLTDEDKKGINDRIDAELEKALNELEKAVDSKDVEAAKKAGEKALDEAKLNYTKEKATSDVEQKGKDANKELDGMIGERQEELDDVNDRLGEIEDRLGEIESELGDLGREIEDLEEKIKDAQGALDNVNSQLAQDNLPEEKRAELEETKKELEQQLKDLQDKKAELEEKRDGLLNEKSDLEQKKTELEGRKSELENEIGQLEDAKKEVDQRVEDAKKDIDKAETVEDVKNAANEAEKDIGGIIDKVDEKLGGHGDKDDENRTPSLKEEKDAAKKELEDMARELENEIKKRNDMTEAEKQEVIDRIESELQKAKDAIDKSVNSEEVEQAKQAGAKAIEDAELNSAKEKAQDDVKKKAQDAKDALDNYPDLSDEDRKAAEDAIDEAAKKAEEAIDNAKTPEDARKAADEAQKAIGDILNGVDKSESNKGHGTPGSESGKTLEQEKEAAKKELENTANNLKDEIRNRDDLTYDEKKDILEKIDEELKKAQNAVDSAVTSEEVEEALQAGKKALEDAELNVAKKKAKDDLDKKAQDAKDAIDGMDGLTDEEKEQAKGEIDDALDNAKKGVDDATNKDELQDAVDQGMSDIVDVVDKADQATGGTLKDAKDGALKDLEDKYEDAKKEIEQNPNLSEEKKKELQDQLDKEYEDAKKKIEQAVTPEEAKQAGEKGVSNIGEIVSQLDNTAEDILDIGVAVVSLVAQAIVIIAAMFIVRRRTVA